MERYDNKLEDGIIIRLYCKTLCYSKPVEMLKYSLRLLLHYLKERTVPLLA